MRSTARLLTVSATLIGLFVAGCTVRPPVRILPASVYRGDFQAAGRLHLPSWSGAIRVRRQAEVFAVAILSDGGLPLASVRCDQDGIATSGDAAFTAALEILVRGLQCAWDPPVPPDNDTVASCGWGGDPCLPRRLFVAGLHLEPREYIIVAGVLMARRLDLSGSLCGSVTIRPVLPVQTP